MDWGSLYSYIFALIVLIAYTGFLYVTCERYGYWLNVILYTIVIGVINGIILLDGLGTILIYTLLIFLLALPVMFALERLVEYCQSSITFFIFAILIQGFMSGILLRIIETLF